MTLDLNALCLDQSFNSGDILKQTEIPIRTPKKDEFFRVHPTYTTGLMGVWRDTENVYHLVYPEVANLEILQGHVRRVVLKLAVNADGLFFIWPLRVADKNGNLDEYARTAHLAAEQAIDSWVRIQANKETSSFTRFIAANKNLRPEPQWPTDPYDVIVTRGFHGNIMPTEDHPLIKRLRGEI
jgi:hypothetical protein